MSDADLQQRDYIVDGINGIDFVQTEEAQDDDMLVLYVNGEARGIDMHQVELMMLPNKPENSNLVQLENPMENPPFNNWSVNQPSPPHAKGSRGNADLGVRNIVIDGVDGFDFVQLDSENPMENPPFNNWSVNQPSPPHAKGSRGTSDLGVKDIIIDGVDGFNFVQTNEDPIENESMLVMYVNGIARGIDLEEVDLMLLKNPMENPPFNNWSVNQPSPPHDIGNSSKGRLGFDIVVKGHPITLA